MTIERVLLRLVVVARICLWCDDDIVRLLLLKMVVTRNLFDVFRVVYDDGIVRLMQLLMVVTRINLWWFELIMMMI